MRLRYAITIALLIIILLIIGWCSIPQPPDPPPPVEEPAPVEAVKPVEAPAPQPAPVKAPEPEATPAPAVDLDITKAMTVSNAGLELNMSYNAEAQSFRGMLKNKTPMQAEGVVVEVTFGDGRTISTQVRGAVAPGGAQVVRLDASGMDAHGWKPKIIWK